MSEPIEQTRPATPLRKAWLAMKLMLRPSVARKVGTLITDGYLSESGWVRSVGEGRVVDARGEPQPWLTLPFVAFLDSRIKPEWTAFEYGAGASTRFFARRVRQIVSVEHDEQFAATLRADFPANAQLLVRSAGSEAYARSILECAFTPDLVLVDGIDRERCIESAILRMAAGAVLVLDDAERPEYAAAIQRLRRAGFKSVEFWGVAPGMVKQKCTAVFYRADNILGL